MAPQISNIPLKALHIPNSFQLPGLKKTATQRTKPNKAQVTSIHHQHKYKSIRIRDSPNSASGDAQLEIVVLKDVDEPVETVGEDRLVDGRLGQISHHRISPDRCVSLHVGVYGGCLLRCNSNEFRQQELRGERNAE